MKRWVTTIHEIFGVPIDHLWWNQVIMTYVITSKKMRIQSAYEIDHVYVYNGGRK